MRSCCLVGGLCSPAGLAGSGFASFDEKILDELTGLHLVELFHAQTEELLGKVLSVFFGDVVLIDDAEDEPLLAIGAVPGIAIGTGVVVPILLTIIDLIAATVAIVGGMTIAVGVGVGTGDETDVLDFLIDGVLQEFIELLHFGFDLGEIREFDFDGG